MSESGRCEEESPVHETARRELEEIMAKFDVGIGYCGWPDCPICRDRGLLPEEKESHE